MPVSLVLFDMDDVLCAYDVGRRVRLIAEDAGLRPLDVHEAIWRSDFVEKADRGAYADAPSCLAEFNRRLGANLTREQWIAQRRAAMIPDEATLALVRALRDAGRRVAIFTNNDRLVESAMGELFPALPELFGDAIYVSAAIGSAKPSPESFRRVAARLGARPADILFVDDLAENVEGATAAGCAGHVFDGAPGLAARLALEGLL